MFNNKIILVIRKGLQVWIYSPCCWMMLLRVGGVLVGLRPAERKSRLMLTDGSDHVDPKDPWPPTPAFCCCPIGCWDTRPAKFWNICFCPVRKKEYCSCKSTPLNFAEIFVTKVQLHFWQFKTNRLVIHTCWEWEWGIVGIGPAAPGVIPPKENVMLWEALSVACGLVSWWLTPLIRSRSSADGGT